MSTEIVFPQRQHQQQQVVSELKRHQIGSVDSDQSDSQVYRTQKDIVVQHQPVAYTGRFLG